MLYFAPWKIWSIVAAVVLAILLALPNLLPPATQVWLAERTIARPMTLGLDLQGGSSVLLEVDRKDLQKNLTTHLIGDIRRALSDAGLPRGAINRTANGVSVRLLNAADAEKAVPIFNRLNQPESAGIFGGPAAAAPYDITRNGEQFTFTFSERGLADRISKAIDQSIKIVERRVNSLGTTEPSIQRQGAERILVQLPGLDDPERVKAVIGQTAKLTFQLLCETQPANPGDTPPPDCEALPQKEDPKRMLWVQTSSVATVDGADLTDAQPAFDQNNEPIVSFTFNTKGALQFGELTRLNVGKPFAIVLDGIVQSAPRINEPILGGRGQISGRFSVDETSDLAIVLRSGALPAKLSIAQESTVGPSLGSDSITAGVVACVIGLVGILIFTIIAYGLFGIFANIALILNLVMLIALMSVFGFTLTLPGIAGIVLTMGMAVDSNVLVFERIREEWRKGRTSLNAIETGFTEALRTVVDANLTTLIAAAVLFGVGSGPIRGFAVTLVIGIITTVFTAFTVTRLIIALWVKRTRPREVPL
jgi:protein-export membrane protein SecD